MKSMDDKTRNPTQRNKFKINKHNEKIKSMKVAIAFGLKLGGR